MVNKSVQNLRIGDKYLSSRILEIPVVYSTYCILIIAYKLYDNGFHFLQLLLRLLKLLKSNLQPRVYKFKRQQFPELRKQILRALLNLQQYNLLRALSCKRSRMKLMYLKILLHLKHWKEDQLDQNPSLDILKCLYQKLCQQVFRILIVLQITQS